MSYPKDLDEYTDKQIVNEYRRRLVCDFRNQCSYCNKAKVYCKCKMSKVPGMFKSVGDDGSVKYYV